MEQCIAIDSYKKRIFSVGGESNGEALNRLKVLVYLFYCIGYLN